MFIDTKQTAECNSDLQSLPGLCSTVHDARENICMCKSSLDSFDLILMQNSDSIQPSIHRFTRTHDAIVTVSQR